MALLDKDAPQDAPVPPDREPAAPRAGSRSERWFGWLDRSGDHLIFHITVLLWIPKTLRRYFKEIQRLLAEVAFGSGGLGVIGGTVGVMIAMTLFTGTV